MTNSLTIDTFKSKDTDFTRNRKLPFWKTTVLILRSWKTSIHSKLTKFFDDLNLLDVMPTASAFCQARKKIKPEIFIALKDETVKFFYKNYEKSGLVKRWNGRLLWAIDGTSINIPDTQETRIKYCIQVNQYKKDGTVQALSSFLYDVLNEICINVVFNGPKSEKNSIFNEHVKHFNKEAIYIYDRLYADYSVLSFHVKEDVDFVIRCRIKQTFTEVMDFVKSDYKDKIVNLKVNKSQIKFVKENRLPEEITVRLVKIKLNNGDIEVLITSLLNKERYNYRDFKWLYNKRWGIETFFNRLKNLLEIERFSSETMIGIEQDFHGLIFLSTFESILTKEDEEELSKQNAEKKLKYQYKINKSVSYSALAEHIAELLLEKNIPPPEILEKLSIIFKTGSSPQRPGRQFKRNIASPSQKLRFYKYGKRVLA
jgi:hypothetical protein